MRKSTIALLVSGAAIAAACSSGGNVTGPGAQDNSTTTASGKKTIILEVKGPAKADITYGLGTDTSQANGAKLPWKKTLTASSSDVLNIAQVSAQNSASGTISCTITVDGKVVKTNKSEGQFAIVDCTTDAF